MTDFNYTMNIDYEFTRKHAKELADNESSESPLYQHPGVDEETSIALYEESLLGDCTWLEQPRTNMQRPAWCPTNEVDFHLSIDEWHRYSQDENTRWLLNPKTNKVTGQDLYDIFGDHLYDMPVEEDAPPQMRSLFDEFYPDSDKTRRTTEYFEDEALSNSITQCFNTDGTSSDSTTGSTNSSVDSIECQVYNTTHDM